MKRKHAQIKYVFLLIFLFSCKHGGKERIDLKSLDFSELFSLYLNSLSDQLEANDSILLFLNDSILQYKEMNVIAREIYSEEKNEFEIIFEVNDPSMYDYSIKERNIYAIQITKYDSLIVEGNSIPQFKWSGNDLKDFITNPTNNELLPEKELAIIPLLDTVWLPKQYFWIFTKLVPDSLGNQTSWSKVHLVYNKILDSYFELRNDSAQRIWSKDFKNLDFQRKKAIVSLLPIRIEILLDWEYIPPPPPPPPLPEYLEQEIDIIEYLKL